MHAFLITGGNGETREAVIAKKLKEWQTSPFDVIIVTRTNAHIGIEEIRTLASRLILKPAYSPLTVGVVRQAELLTPEAQNALLKTLEEPPERASIILETGNASALLPTVVSRCYPIDLGTEAQYSPDELWQCLKTLEQLARGAIGQRLKITGNIAQNREEAVAWVDLATAATREAWLSALGQSTRSTPRPKGRGMLRVDTERRFLLRAKARSLAPSNVSTIPQFNNLTMSYSKLLRGLIAARGQLSANVNPKLVLDNLFLQGQ